MKKLALVILLATLVASCLVMSACDTNGSTPDHLCEFGEWTVTKQPTCTEVGERERFCSCGEKQTSSLAATGHSYTHVVTDPTCTEQGFTTHTCACGDSYVDTYVKVTDHSYTAVVTDPTCTKQGFTTYTCACGDSYVDTYVDALDHDEIEHIAQAPTCTEIGWDVYVTCSRCNYSTYIEISATGHSHSAVVTPPTCTEQGFTTHTCACGDSYIDTYVDATGHSHSAVVTPPACTEQGFTTHTCACGDSYVDTYVDATGHTWGDWYETKAPTDTEAGEERRDCDNCDAYETNELPMLEQEVLINGTWGDLTWTLKQSTGELVISGEGEMDALTQESTSAWREYKDLIKSVTIENGVTTIGDCAFVFCDSLTKVTFGDNSQLTSIGGCAFGECDSLTSIVIPDSVTTIGYVAFAFCDNLTSITFGENSQLTSIGDEAFAGCESLTSVTIGDSVDIIGDFAFAVCTSLISIEVDENNPNYQSIDGNLYSKDGHTLIRYAIGKADAEVIMPYSVTTIGAHAFTGCTSLTNVTFGEDSQLTTIGEGAFTGCTSLTNVTFGEDSQLATIGTAAFVHCYNLTSVTIPNSVTTIGVGAFYNCTSLIDVYYTGTEEQWNAIDIDNTEGYNSSLLNATIHFLGEEEEPALINGTWGDLTWTLNETTGELVIFGTGEMDAFDSGSTSAWRAYKDIIKSVTIENGVTTIGSCAFYSCDRLTSVMFGENSQLNAIGDGAFVYCRFLTSITIPAGVTTIDPWAFVKSGIIDVYYTGTEEQWNEIEIDSHNDDLLNATIHFLGEEDEEPALINGTWGSLTWTLNETTGELVISGEGKMNGFFVVLGSSAWGNYSGLIKSVTIDNGVTTIGDFAFVYCDRLTSIEIPASVTTIGNLVFGGCTSLTSINVDADNTAYKSIEGNLHSKDGKTLVQYAIGKTDTAFAIPDSVTTIGDYAFYGCDSLTSVTFGEDSQLTTIGAAAFAACTSLTSIVIPSSVTTISSLYTSLGLNTFSSCYALAEVYNYSSLNITKGSSSYGHVAYYALDVYTTSEQSKLSTDENGFVIHTDGNVKTLVRYIGAASEITIPNSITAIGVGAFYNCDSLTSVVIPDSVTAIGNDAFYNCYALAEVYNYSSLNITKGSTGYGYVAYYALDVYTTNEPSNLTNDNGLIIHSDGTLVCYVGTDTEIAIPSSVTTIGAHAFTGCTNLTNVTFGEDSQLTTIGEYAFYGCSSLTSVIFGEDSQLTIIGAYAFSGCYNLTSMDIPDGVTTIGGYAFSGCSSLTSIVIPDSVTTIGDYAFCNCSSLKDVYYIGTIEDWCGITFSSSSSNPMYYGTNLHVNGELLTGGLVIANTITEIKAAAFYGCTGLTSVTFGENSQLTTIGSSAFYGCTGLTSITIPDSVTAIGSNAFYNCSSLTSVTFGDNSQLTTIGHKAFEGCSSLKYNTHDNSKYLGNETNPYLVLIECISGEINESCKIIGGSAFAPISFMLMDIIIPDSVTTISTDAFYGCIRLTNVTFGDNSQLTTIGDYAFEDCTSLTSIAIPDSVTSIGEAAFACCESLTSVIIGNNATTIGEEAFAWCESLISVTFGENSQLITIGDCAFDGCSSLTSIVIPDSVKIIGMGAFSDCDSLTNVYYGGSESEWENITIDSYNAELTNATRYYYSETEPTTSGNYWHYVDGVPTKW